jgi:hypothetical protein
MRPFLLFGLILLTACGAKSSSVKYGKTTVSDLIKEKGEPLSEEAIPVKEGKVLHFADGDKYQISGEIVTSGFIDPKTHQRTLLFWKHQFKSCHTILKKLPSQSKNHELPEFELACPEEGKSVIYTEGSEFVSRIVEYESK